MPRSGVGSAPGAARFLANESELSTRPDATRYYSLWAGLEPAIAADSALVVTVARTLASNPRWFGDPVLEPPSLRRLLADGVFGASIPR